MKKLKAFLKVWAATFTGITIIMVALPALAFQEGYPATGASVVGAQLHMNLDEMWQFGKKFFNPGTAAGYSLPYTGGRVCFGSTTYTVSDGSADFSSYVNGNVVYVSIIESGGSAVLSEDLGAYNTNGIPLWRVTIGASAISSVTDDRTWVQKGSAATVKTTQSFPFEGIWATMGSNIDKFAIQRAGTAVSLVYNASYSGGTWAVQDSTKPQARIDYTAAGNMEFYTSPAAGSCAWTEAMAVTPTGVSALKPLVVSAPLTVSGTSSYLLLPSLTTAQRDALTAANGMMIYNTTTGRFEKYENGGWNTSSGRAYYTAPGTYTWTAPSGVHKVFITGCGGGGGGGACISYNQNNGIGGGGGAGACSIGFPIAVTPGTAYNVVVGAAGLGGVNGGAASAGGTTSFGDTLIVLGGGGAGGSGAFAVNGAGGAAGAGGIYIFSSPGLTGGSGGAGGNCAFGNGGAAVANGSSGQGATGHGGGGSGGNETNNTAVWINGGNGTPGMALIEW